MKNILETRLMIPAFLFNEFRRRPWAYGIFALFPMMLSVVSELLMVLPGRQKCYVPFVIAHIVVLNLWAFPVYGVMAGVSFIWALLQWRARPIMICLCAVVALGSVPAGMKMGDLIRMESMKSATKRGANIIAAVQAFKVKFKRYPRDLGELIPEYLTEIPGTGLCAYPEFSYRTDSNGLDFELSVSTSRLGINFDELIYSPRDPRHITDPYTRLGDWIYIHE